MHFAFPPRKDSHPPPYAARSRRLPFSQYLRRNRIRAYAAFALGILAFLWLVTRLFSGSGSSSSSTGAVHVHKAVPYGTPPVVIVTTINKGMDRAHSERVKQNRINYAKKHGYDTFTPFSDDYELGKHPQSWSKIPAMRHAMKLFPYSEHFWFLDEHALIMNPSLSLEKHIIGSTRLENLMIKDVPVVPPDSVIKTFSHLRAQDIDLVVAQDKQGLCQSSFLLRRGDWAKFFLDSWFDPLYRSYNFQKADGHALEHLVQWHGTILAKLALIPQRTFNSYIRTNSKMGKGDQSLYDEGDFVANFIGCDKGGKSCADEMRPFFDRLTKSSGK